MNTLKELGVSAVIDPRTLTDVTHGPGYRVYFMQRGLVVIVLLCGGDKSKQDADIRAAKRIAQDWKS